LGGIAHEQGAFVSRFVRLALFTITIFHGVIAQSATPLQKVVFVFAVFNERTGYVFVAKEMRFFEEQGLDVQIVQVRNGQVAVSALAANEAQFYSVSATGASLGAMAAGLDLAFIAGIVNKLDGDFVVSPNIATPADLKGKFLGVQSIGGGVWTFTMLALDHWGLVPERDRIQFRIVGDQAVLTQGLINGTVDAASRIHFQQSSAASRLSRSSRSRQS
jgi:ABC-type nitrate/sulfonate/bicarbonate transport system substrate-binding protein